MRCLIAEDNDMVRAGLGFFMAEHAETELAANGRDAVVKFQEALEGDSPFDLVLLDIVMPEMDGQQALKLIRSAERHNASRKVEKAVIIMTTALTSPDSMEEALWEGDCTDYLVKPVVREDLMAVLRRYGLAS